MSGEAAVFEDQERGGDDTVVLPDVSGAETHQEDLRGAQDTEGVEGVQGADVVSEAQGGDRCRAGAHQGVQGQGMEEATCKSEEGI